MAFKLDNDLLEELGLAALSSDEKQAMLRQILETLEMRVGTTLASNMTDAQLDEFEQLMPTQKDDQATIQQKEQQALQWLESNFPNYKQVVNNELEKLKLEIQQSAPQIVAASQQQQATVPPVASQPAYPSQGSVSPALATTSPYPQNPPASPPQPLQDLSGSSQPAPGFVPPATPPSLPTQAPVEASTHDGSDQDLPQAA